MHLTDDGQLPETCLKLGNLSCNNIDFSVCNLVSLSAHFKSGISVIFTLLPLQGIAFFEF